MPSSFGRGIRAECIEVWQKAFFAQVRKDVVPLAGLEPAQAAYLALTGYKTAALPIELQGLISQLISQVFGARGKKCSRDRI